MKSLLLVLVSLLPLVAADVTGTWVGTVQVPSGIYQATLTLAQKGGEVSGAIATSGESYPLQKVKLSGKNLSFEVTADQVYAVECVLENDRITGGIKPAYGGSGKIDVMRSK